MEVEPMTAILYTYQNGKKERDRQYHWWDCEVNGTCIDCW